MCSAHITLEPVLKLPLVRCSTEFPYRISASTLAAVLRRPEKYPYTKILVIDARSAVEFSGGHIQFAKNITIKDYDKLERLFHEDCTKDTLVVFHCEFSSHRGPELAAKFRALDRKLKGPAYPELFYPETYVLDGGYCEFYKRYPDLCVGSYTKMCDCGAALRRCRSQRIRLKMSLGDDVFSAPDACAMSRPPSAPASQISRSQQSVYVSNDHTE